MAKEYPAMPAEVIEVIVREVAQDPDTAPRKRTLAHIALCSWAFKNFAHKHLFAEIELHGSRDKSATPRIRRFLNLINDDPHSEVTGIASYVRKLSMQMIGVPSMIRPTLDDGTMATLFRKIFNTGEPGSGPRSLSLSLGSTSNLRRTFDWSSFNQDFRDAFRDVCEKPLLTTLQLSGFINVPADLLRNTVITNVTLLRIRLLGTESFDFGDPSTFVLPSDGEIHASDLPFRQDEVVFLESIHTDLSFPLLEILDMTPRRSIPPDVVFSRVRSLTLEVSCKEDLQHAVSLLAQGLETLEQLELDFNYYMRDTSESLDLSQLPRLKSLVLKHNSVSYSSPGLSVIPQICQLLDQQPPPTLRSIDVALFLFSRPNDHLVENIFDGYEYELLDELFSHPKFYCLQHLALRFLFNIYDKGVDFIQQFQAAASVYVRKVLPEVNTVTKSGPLQVDVIISPVRRHVA